MAEGRYEIGYFTMVMAMLFNLFSEVKNFSYFLLNQNWYIRTLDAYYDVMNFKETPVRPIGAADVNVVNNNVSGSATGGASDGVVALKDIRYQYIQSEQYALRGISCAFKRGEKIAVVGRNGGGKTTLVSVVLGLLKNFEGVLTLEGSAQNAAGITAILQDFGQYQMTVKENIELGCGGRELSEGKIIEILKKVDLYEFITAKPEGIYTKLGQLEESGVELSKGQWQRIAIGRLLANEDARIWILDEPTAYLDPIAEIEMYKFIFNIAEDRLMFFISHRLGFAKNADRIIVINDGVIAEDGVHEELMRQNGLYAKMFNAQREWYW